MANDVVVTSAWYEDITGTNGDTDGTGTTPIVDTSGLLLQADKSTGPDVDNGTDDKWVNGASLKYALDKLDFPKKTFTAINLKQTDTDEYGVSLDYTDEYGTEKVLEDSSLVLMSLSMGFKTIFTCTGDVKLEGDGKYLISYDGGVLTPYISDALIPAGTHTIYGADVTTVKFKNDFFTSIEVVKAEELTNGYRMFHTLSNLVTFKVGTPNVFKNCANFESCWGGCSSLTSFPYINTTNATSLRAAWYNCSLLTSFPLLLTSKVTTFRSAWYKCESLEYFPAIDTSSATDLESTWRECRVLKDMPFIDTSKVKKMYATWWYCLAIPSFPPIDTSSVTDMRSTWGYCKSIVMFPAIDTSGATDMRATWVRCESMTVIQTLDTSKAVRLNRLFDGCLSLIKVPTIDTASATTVENMFKNCLSLICIDSIIGRSLLTVVTSDSPLPNSMFYGNPSILSPNAAEQASIIAGNDWVNPNPC